MTLPQVIFVILAVSASLSRLFSLLYLWQMKEWRVDRLREHLRAEGWALQLYGGIEPVLILTAFVLSTYVYHDALAVLTALVALNFYGCLKSVLGRQRSPVWTSKAFALAIATIALTCAAALVMLIALPAYPSLLLLLPIFTPFFLACSLLALTPLDALLKWRVFTRAKRLRAARNNLTVIGITGSVGKTTTKELLSHIFAADHPLVTPAHVNSEMGVAQWICRELPTHPDATLMIVEMGAYRMGEIALLCEIAQPQLGIITFIGEQHLALFGSRKAICKAKGELFAALPENGHAFANADSDMCTELLARCACSATTVGTGGNSALTAFDIEETANGVRFRAKDTLFGIPIQGTHNVTNILLAIAAAMHLGMAPKAIASRLRSFTLPHRTFEVTKSNGVTILDDTYNASPASFKAAIAWSRNQPHEKKYLLSNGIMELGEEESNIHEELGGIAKNVFDEVYTLNKKFMQDFSRGYGKKLHLFPEEKPPIKPNDLLICVGRMPASHIEKLFT